ncbi:MAG TPA: ornithine cyclodeaminase family protein [Amaricoccus sp.]|uniref:iminosuccinate reductase BhcD n=1 Tax=Amaricoccus sp. TaxID=1872485 RepID=UPI002BFCA087|nr:iminosuccinate reductase BhcD [Amaricoccus sp.]HMQ92004.1 ornithine cyclodeaminase family protein [Amaricoccus sp.]HMR53752.1 ornithine cyclodeaminase family protein [Amaricoccus sp.]HMR60877.1 ornithine cyclodeaminase family protein [Amaricoccus sp.]HMU00743.1 ornithine cyclodeaminase family protein [Amaricoccus sp.]
MIIVPEKACPELMTLDAAVEAVEAVFGAMARGDAYNFPVVREAIGHADALYGFKGGFDRAGLTLGVKAGGYWPHNLERYEGLGNHQSTVFLFDPDTGRPVAVVGGNYLTAARTAAASAVSIRHLARKDSKVLGMVGAGHQSAFQMRAAAQQRDFERVVGWNFHPEMLSRLADTAAELGLPFQAVELDQLGAESDVIITITSSNSPILKREHVRPGTHVACMGTDTKGKQEVEAELLGAAEVFTDEVAQSVSIGEAQHAIASGLIAEGDIAQIGAVVNGTHAGRSSAEAITLFDGTGVGLQDLAVAASVVQLARAAGKAIEVEF